MLQQLIATHARAAALVVAVLAALVTWFSGLVLTVSDQMADIAQGQRNAQTQLLAIRTEVVETLRRLAKDFQPACGALNMQTTRELLFSKRYIGDIGIFDDQGRLSCTTTLGDLPQPFVPGKPHLVQTLPEGEVISNFYNVPLLVARSTVHSTISRMGRFNVVVYPHAIDDLLSAGASAVLVRTPEGVIRAVAQSETLPALWRERFLTPAYAGEDMLRFQWADMAFVAVHQVPGTVYSVQSVVSAAEFYKTRGRYLAAALAAALVIGMLVYLSVKPVFLYWLALEHRISRLLVADNIVCMYQPIVDLQTGRTVGCEVLMRLRDGDTIIYPDQAIPSIVARGLTWTLDQAVVRKAIGELARAVPQVRDFKVAFNFFPDNVLSGPLRALFAQALQETPHAGLHFDIEVIEQHFQESMLDEVAELRRHGFLVSVDDFGTGFSNLRSVKAISPDFLKIDRSYVMDMEDDSVRSTLIPEIVGIGRAVGARIIAEGIENERQLQRLKALGVEFGQGYYFARPQPIEQFAQSIGGSYSESLDRSVRSSGSARKKIS